MYYRIISTQLHCYVFPNSYSSFVLRSLIFVKTLSSKNEINSLQNFRLREMGFKNNFNKDLLSKGYITFKGGKYVLYWNPIWKKTRQFLVVYEFFSCNPTNELVKSLFRLLFKIKQLFI